MHRDKRQEQVLVVPVLLCATHTKRSPSTPVHRSLFTLSISVLVILLTYRSSLFTHRQNGTIVLRAPCTVATCKFNSHCFGFQYRLTVPILYLTLIHYDSGTVP